MVTFAQFIEQVNINLTNLFQHPDAVVQCATKEGAYYDEYLGEHPITGLPTFSAIAFEDPGQTPWDQPLDQKEFLNMVMETFAKLILEGVFEEDEELEDDEDEAPFILGQLFAGDDKNSFTGGAGI